MTILPDKTFLVVPQMNHCKVVQVYTTRGTTLPFFITADVDTQRSTLRNVKFLKWHAVRKLKMDNYVDGIFYTSNAIIPSLAGVDSPEWVTRDVYDDMLGRLNFTKLRTALQSLPQMLNTSLQPPIYTLIKGVAGYLIPIDKLASDNQEVHCAGPSVFTKRRAQVILLDRKGDIFIVRRGRPPCEGLWEFPGDILGLDADAALYPAVLRSLRLKLNVRAQSLYMADTTLQDVSDAGMIHATLMTTFICSEWHVEPHTLDDTHDLGCWVSLDDAGSPDYPMCVNDSFHRYVHQYLEFKSNLSNNGLIRLPPKLG